MNEKELQIFDGLIAEYELRAKYNDDQRDYNTYSMLVKARGILTSNSRAEAISETVTAILDGLEFDKADTEWILNKAKELKGETK